VSRLRRVVFMFDFISMVDCRVAKICRRCGENLSGRNQF
jgi:hypothetical protein